VNIAVLRGGGGTALPFVAVSEALILAAAVLAIAIIERITTLQTTALHALPTPTPLTHA
jgi:hypothetical protein